MTEIEQHAMSREDAERLTERIRLVATTFMEARDKLARLVHEAQEGRAHESLGFRSWTEYIAAVCSETPLMRLSRDERKVIVADLAEQGMSSRAIAPVVGASQRTVVDDLRSPEQNCSPAEVPAVPSFDPDPIHVDRDTGEVRTITGRDGKTYTRPTPAPVEDEAPRPRRRPLPDQFRDATSDLRKVTDRLVRLIEDERFPRNREQVALIHQSDLSRATEALAKVTAAFNN